MSDMEVCRQLRWRSESVREVISEIIRPYHESDNASPETEMEKSDRVQPRTNPQTAGERMLLDFYFDLFAPRCFRACFRHKPSPIDPTFYAAFVKERSILADAFGCEPKRQ